MTFPRYPHDRSGRFLDALERVLIEGKYKADTKRFRAIALNLCRLLRSDFDSQQAQALDVAEGYDAQRVADHERLQILEAFSKRLDRDPKSKTWNVNRLIWSALNTITGLTGEAGEFLFGLAEDAELDPQAIEDAFRNELPELAASRHP